MAGIHVLESGPNRTRVVLHIAVPNTNNAVGMNWRLALTRSKLGGATILPDGDGTQGTIDATEKTSVISGAIYEVVVDAKRLPATNPALDAFAAKAAPEILSSLQAALNFYGHTRP